MEKPGELTCVTCWAVRRPVATAGDLKTLILRRSSHAAPQQAPYARKTSPAVLVEP